MKRMLFIALVVPSFVCAMQPETQKPQLKLSTKNKIFLGVQGAAATYDILHPTLIVAQPFCLPLTVTTGLIMIGGDALYTWYKNNKANNLENNK